MRLHSAILCLGLLTHCGTEPKGLTPEEISVMGTWAGSFMVGTNTFSAVMRNEENKSYSTVQALNGQDISREAGTWSASGGRYITRPELCEEAPALGAPLYVIACTGPDTLSINIIGDTWNLNFINGGIVYTLPLRKI